VFVYLCVGRDASATKTPISEIVAIFPEKGEFVPPDYEVVLRRGAPANLNAVSAEMLARLQFDVPHIAHSLMEIGDARREGLLVLSPFGELVSRGCHGSLSKEGGSTSIRVCWR
jgi:hypothetical protein